MRVELEDGLLRRCRVKQDLWVDMVMQTITAAVTIPDSGPVGWAFDATATDRTITLPTQSDGKMIIIGNVSSSTAVLTVANAAATTICSLGPSSIAIVLGINGVWIGLALSETLSAAELAVLDGVTPGTALASKALVLNSSKGIATITSATITTLTSTTVNATTLAATTVTATGAISSSSASLGIGYATGAGSTVTQITSRATTVVINAICGSIQTDVSSLAAGAEAEFTVTNSAVAATDVIVLSLKQESSTGTTLFFVSTVAAGSFKITGTNLHASTADTSASIINFAVIKAVTA